MRTGVRFRQFVTHELWTMDLDRVPRVQRVALRVLRLVLVVAFEFRLRLNDA
ncbi:MAG: hypothetical protein EWM73_01260 [Nitrospira sp.]|nr:MAG: hypothetical protein EWM73_01260 [Nitrospira sp.]